MTDIAVFLGRCDLFSGLPDESRKSIAGLCKSITLAKNDLLFIEGRPGNAMYVLASGSIKLMKTSPQGGEVVIKTVEPGDIFAEVMLLERDRYPVSAVALKKSVVYELLRRDFRTLLARETFRESFIVHLSRRLRYLTDKILFLTTSDVEDRFFHFLAEQFGEKLEYTITMSKKDIAAAIGATPETFSRLITRLSSDRKISWKGKLLRIANRK